MMLPRLSYCQLNSDILTAYDQRLSYTENDLKLPLLSAATRGRSLSSICALLMERNGYLELCKCINGKGNHSLFKELMTDQEFSGMYWAIERHHRDLRLAHLTGQSKDIMEQAQKDTKFYNILIKMLCEVKKLPVKKQKESLKKVHSWYRANRHTLMLGPCFGKTSQKLEAEEILKNAKHAAKFQSSSAKENSEISRQSSAVKTRKQSGRDKIKSAQKGGSDFKQFIHDTREMEDDVSTPQGHRENGFPMSDLGSHYAGNDFLTSRFFSELPTSKLSWNLDSPMGKSPYENMQTPTEWEGTEAELQRIQESALSAPGFSDHFHRSSPVSHDNDSIVSHGSNSNVSSRVDAGSLDMMDFSSDVRRRLSRGQTPSASLRAGGMSGMTPDESSTEVYGLQKRMVHSIASLVNPHAKLAEDEAKRAEQEYFQSQQPHPSRQSFRSGSKVNVPLSSKADSDYRSGTPVLRPVSVMGNRIEALQNFQSFSKDHLYGQDILSKLNFVGRSGTALDVRYSAHNLGDMPENHTKELINLYGVNSDDNEMIKHVIKDEGNIHDQPLEEFYQTADTIYPTHLPKYTGSRAVRDRIKSAPAHRAKIAKPFKSPVVAEKGGKREKTGTPVSQKTLGGKDANKENEQHGERPKSAVNLDTVISMIDSVKDEMYFFKEKLAPSPMPGFRQPAHSGVPTKPLSRPPTARSGRSIPRPRSPSPQQRPSTPTDQDSLMMDEGEILSTTGYQPNAFPVRPHSATVNRAVDWRGKVTPEAGKYKPKTRFGGHTYVQKMKPSLRTAGAVTGKRPKTAPVNMKDKWKTEKESDKNVRVPQAASNTVVEVDQKDVDSMLNISYLTGHTDSRFGSMTSLYLDEEFLRSFGSRYTPMSARSASQNTTKEYLSLIGPTPVTPTAGSRSQSCQGLRKSETGIEQIPEESVVKDSSLQAQVGGLPAELQLQLTEPTEDETELVETGREPGSQGLSADEDFEQEIADEAEAAESGGVERDQETDKLKEQETEELAQEEYPNLYGVEIDKDTEENKVDTLNSGTQTVKFPREPVVIHTETQENSDVHIEVTAIPAFGPVHVPSEGHVTDLKKLTKSETWQFHPDESTLMTLPDGVGQSQHIVKPENYCVECIPRGMATKVGRSAGRMPGGTQSPSGQVLRMSRKQNEYFKKAPPVRTPPSIPSPHHPLGGRSPRLGQQYIAELEHHARKDKSPRHYLEKVVELRKDTCRSAPAGTRKRDDNDMTLALNVISLKTQGRSKTAPTLHSVRQHSDSFLLLQPFPEEAEEETSEQPDTTRRAGTERSGVRAHPAPNTASQSIAHIGRPIAQVSKVPDPAELEEAVIKQREAKAAVDIQRIFRGYVCRSSYNKLLWENRKKSEDKQMALVETQREFRKHQERKARIYNRPPLDPALLQWAKDFKQLQMQNLEKRQEKRDIMAKEMVANQVKQKSKIELIGPHVEIYDIYHPKEIGPTKREMHVAAVIIQKNIRGFLVRGRFERMKRKATYCGSTWKKVVQDYKSQLIRVQRWHGVEMAKTPFSVDEMNDYMDSRRRYESQFDKKAFGEELELEELESFFHECDLYPSSMEIDDGLDVIFQGRSLKGHGLKKQDALNLLFYIYVPPATGLENTRQSTWMNPIIDGVEAKKLIGTEFVEKTPLGVCADLVMTSKRERREKEEVERQKQLEEEEEDSMSVNSEGGRKSSYGSKKKHGEMKQTRTSENMKKSLTTKRTYIKGSDKKVTF